MKIRTKIPAFLPYIPAIPQPLQDNLRQINNLFLFRRHSEEKLPLSSIPEIYLLIIITIIAYAHAQFKQKK